jgi:integrase/recombinase XerD
LRGALQITLLKPIEKTKLSPFDVAQENIMDYIATLQGNLSVRSTARNLSALKMFFRFLVSDGKIKGNPARRLGVPKLPQRLPEVLTVHEVEILISQPDVSIHQGQRDKTMLELLYATGLRVSELVGLRVSNINLEAGYVEKKPLSPYGPIS